VTYQIDIDSISSKDIEDVSEILSKMNAKFRSIERRGERHLRGWIVNKDNQGVGWIIFENLHYSSLRFHRSIYEFNCEELQLRLDNWQLKKQLQYERHGRLELHSQLRELNESKNKGYLSSLFMKLNQLCESRPFMA